MGCKVGAKGVLTEKGWSCVDDRQGWGVVVMQLVGKRC
jgi:hypothetical protein